MRKLLLACFAIVALSVSAAFAQETGKSAQPGATTIQLPQPSKSGGMALTEALARRRSTRTFTAKALTQAEISQLLWAAQGITDDKGHRTAPSASAQYYIHVYLASADGFFEYIPSGHQLKKLQSQDLRAKLSVQPSVKSAPIVLVITGEYERAVAKAGADKGPRLVALEAGHVAQNVLLQATALGLGAVPVAGFEPKDAQQAASLPAQHTPIYLMPIGRID
ncbi:MAG: SagB/ThcOx family dehydrogenase [Candidatus Korobacteraceae bacterium]|jgi:SagB-type dehydrogenase family enzyme